MLWQRRYNNKPSSSLKSAPTENLHPNHEISSGDARKRPRYCPTGPLLRGIISAVVMAALVVVGAVAARNTRIKHPSLPPREKIPGSSLELLPSSRSGSRVPVSDTYITLWLHQVHRWFQGTRTVADFLAEARAAGFTSMMGDLPWEWTERERGAIDLDSFDKGWMRDACGAGFRLHVVLTMRELPPWLQSDPNSAEYVEIGQSTSKPKKPSGTPAMAHPFVWKLARDFASRASQMLVEKYGDCLETISPTWNNEFETRFVQTELMLRDYSAANVASYREWLLRRGLPPKDPPLFDSWVVCPPGRMSIDEANWLRYRQEFLVERYDALCRIVASHGASCLLHFGEFFATVTDRIHSTPFFDLARSPHVGHLVMDSNMALSGAPASPSIVGIMVSAAQRHNKTVHYEAATERIVDSEAEVPSDGGMALSNVDWERGSPLLLRRGLEYALDAGVQSIGVTNLRQPDLFRRLLRKVAEDSGVDGGGGVVAESRSDETAQAPPRLRTAMPFRPTAILYVPYQAFAAWFVVVSGFCSIPATECWHESFRNMTFFGYAEYARNKNGAAGACPVDVAQYGVIQAWDDLRRRHEQVAVAGDMGQLSDDLLAAATERVVVVFPGITDGPGPWKFFDGQRTKLQFEAICKKFPFTERHLSILGGSTAPGSLRLFGWS